MRAGTEAVPQIAAFGAAAEVGAAQANDAHRRMEDIRAHIVTTLSNALEEPKDIRFIGGGAPHILSISLPGGTPLPRRRNASLPHDREYRWISYACSSRWKNFSMRR